MHTFTALKEIVRGARDGRLTAADCRLLVCAHLVQTLALAAVVCAPILTARRALARIRRGAIALCGPSAEPRLIWAIEASARWRVGPSTCLARALAAELLLPAVDRPLTLVIGVTSPVEGHLKSHAWIERDGRVIIGGSESRRHYLPLIAWNGGTV